MPTAAPEDALPGDPTRPIPFPVRQEWEGQFPRLGRGGNGDRAIAQMMLRYRNTLPCRAARCPSRAATPPFCAVQRSGRKKIRKGTFAPKTMGKGDEPLVPKRQSGRRERSPGGAGGHATIPLPADPTGSHGRPGAEVKPPTRSCLPGQPRVKGRPDAAVMGVTLIDTCHLMGSVNASLRSRRTRMSILNPAGRSHPCRRREMGCHLGKGGTTTHKTAGERGRAPGQGLAFTNSSNIPGRRLRVMHRVGNVSHCNYESFVTQ